MKKGDLKKREILQTAEMLFCRKGYEKTSIQDILDSLKTSKGSFYHHFVSKEALLETLCKNRAEQSLEITVSRSECQDSAAGRLDRLLTGMVPLHDEKLSFLVMLLPTFILPEGRVLKASYADSLKNAFFKPVRDAIREGTVSGELACSDPDICAEIVLLIVNRLWLSICDIIIGKECSGTETDLSEILHITEQYRNAAERILSTPCGSLVLIDIPSLKALTAQIHMHWHKTYNTDDQRRKT